MKEVVLEQAGILGEEIRCEQFSHLASDTGKGKRGNQFFILVGYILSIFENAARGDPYNIPLRGLPDPFNTTLFSFFHH